jgi:hypothetical protein
MYALRAGSSLLAMGVDIGNNDMYADEEIIVAS